MSVKKAFAPIVAFLNENSNKKVSSIIDEVTAMCSAKGAGGTATASVTDESGRLFVRCSYFQKWIPAAIVTEAGEFKLFGAKNGSATGLNPMCKEGANVHAKKQREAKAANDGLLSRVEAGELEVSEIGAAKAEIETARQDRPEFSMPEIAFETAEDAMALSNEDYAAILESCQTTEEVDETGTDEAA